MPSISVMVVFSSECFNIELPSLVAASRSSRASYEASASWAAAEDPYTSLSCASFRASAVAVPTISSCQSNELGRDYPCKLMAVAWILNV